MTVHVIGAGLAGLTASVHLAAQQERVVVYEASPQAGGRCRSFEDKTLGCVIDNGNHLLLSGNLSALRYLKTIGSEQSLVGPAEALYPFVDLKTGDRWQLRINKGRLPYWIANPLGRVPGSKVRDYLAARRLAMAGDRKTVAQCLQSTGELWDRLWDPLSTSVLNTPSEIGSAKLLWAALKESFAKGGTACRPLVAEKSLAASFIDPALTYLMKKRADLFFGQRLRSIEVDRHVKSLHFNDLSVVLEPGDHVVLAVPPTQLAELVPTLDVPKEAHAIVNAHFRLSEPKRLPGRSRLLGVVGGTAQWIFLRDDILSLTVSAADRLAEEPSEAIAEILWLETARALGQPAGAPPPNRIIKEKRATFSQTPDALARRPSTDTRWSNLYLAGDWTDTGLPATIEGAVRSGYKAADAILATRQAKSSS